MMKRIFVVLLFAASVGAQTTGQLIITTKAEVKIAPLEEGTVTYFIVTAVTTAGADEAIVTVCYWTDFPGVVDKILRCKDSVIPPIENIGVLSDSVPVSLSEIASVRVRLVRVVFDQKFPFKAAR